MRIFVIFKKTISFWIINDEKQFVSCFTKVKKQSITIIIPQKSYFENNLQLLLSFNLTITDFLYSNKSNREEKFKYKFNFLHNSSIWHQRIDKLFSMVLMDRKIIIKFLNLQLLLFSLWILSCRNWLKL